MGGQRRRIERVSGRDYTVLDTLSRKNGTRLKVGSRDQVFTLLILPDSPATHNTPFRAGKGFLYEGGLRVPAIVRWPGVIPSGKVIDVPIIQADWVPTLLEACGVKTDDKFDGASLLPILKGKSFSDRPLFWHFPHHTNQGSRPAGAMRDASWKLVEHYDDGVEHSIWGEWTPSIIVSTVELVHLAVEERGPSHVTVHWWVTKPAPIVAFDPSLGALVDLK